MAEKLLTLF